MTDKFFKHALRCVQMYGRYHTITEMWIREWHLRFRPPNDLLHIAFSGGSLRDAEFDAHCNETQVRR